MWGRVTVPSASSEGSATDSDEADRRRHERFRLAIPAYLRPPGRDPVIPVRTTNLSRGGFLCLTGAALELGTVLHARLQLTPHEALDCRAQVVRVDEPSLVRGIEVSVVALRFMDLAEAKQQQLERALVELGADPDAADVPQAYRSAR